ncbi:MAG TPA: sulfite exporter TauE/SafE family protein [Candidatus Tumulicola sp.]|jgi:hypothetical protein
MLSNLVIVLIGFVVGTIVGLTGVGAAGIMTPLLIIALHVNPMKAVGTDLLYSVPTKLYGAFLHNRQKTVNPDVVKALLWGGIPASLVGLLLLFWLRRHVEVTLIEAWTRRAVGVTVFIAAFIIIVQPLIRRKVVTQTFEWHPRQRGRVIAIGALVGLIVTITSIGSGSVTLPLLTLAIPFAGLAQLIGSDIAFAAFLIPLAALGRWTMGDVDLPLVIKLLIGSLPGIYVGTKLCGVLDQRWLRPVVAVVLIVVGIRLLT